ncbi:sulfite exporter TauE/SafE family protein [Mycolicibacterium sp.]|uniref:sulfite exporter TauE/SafE family protein n=1 Tax=Mycolicibacterium sp. TaxID=2320850 RepID=UPI001A19DB91|nr:sulfite exporter TauE/SafE family protein [Mycolicibacterium sp.]MBJ7338134.1 sulfite exporter TauE/SafE family protein [Mycolicibacterium sp.]
MIALTISLAIVVGVALGLLGGGGSILTVPLLAYVAGLDARAAIATSLLVVAATSVVSAITHARAGRIQWRIAALFGAAAMAGAYTGGRLARYVPGTVLLVAFAIIMIGAGIAMLLGRKDVQPGDDRPPLPILRISLLGVGVGIISGLVGAGGGFLLVPALVLLTGLPMPVAVGTSLVIISVQSFAGFAGHLAGEHIDWHLAGYVTVAAVVGALIGGRLITRIDPAALRQLFGWFVLLMASLMLAEEVHPILGATTAAATLLAAALSIACTRYEHCPIRQMAHRRRAAAG